jgi:formylglycine-generating enzyme required for sulfatase activity
MLGYVIAVLACGGANCSVTQPEPAVSYPNFETCSAALDVKSAALNDFVAHHQIDGRTSNIVCLQSLQTITEVEYRYDVVETTIVRTEPSDTAPSVGVAEAGQRLVATGEVAGTPWLRVVLRDGRAGFVFGDRLRRVDGPTAPPAQQVVAAGPGSGQPPQTPPGGEVPGTKPPPSQEPPPPAEAKPVPTAPLLAGEFRSCEHCPVMVPVPAGAFAMGSNDDPTEKPLHRVAVPSFGIGKFPVSVGDWDACATAGGCALKPPGGQGDPARTPMSNLSWDDAVQYVAWLRQSTGKPYRLPSEAEWEYAARAGTTTRYWWGEQAGSNHADCDGCGDPHDAAHPQPVDAFPPNPWGLYAMSGGVAEWVDDCWHLSYLSQQGAPTDGSSWAFANCTRHVLRGGSWRSTAAQVTVSARNAADANVRNPANGMRVALSLP